jgi:hypothetical protein
VREGLSRSVLGYLTTRRLLKRKGRKGFRKVTQSKISSATLAETSAILWVRSHHPRASDEMFSPRCLIWMSSKFGR